VERHAGSPSQGKPYAKWEEQEKPSANNPEGMEKETFPKGKKALARGKKSLTESA